jgi:hypothetical protein
MGDILPVSEQVGKTRRHVPCADAEFASKNWQGFVRSWGRLPPDMQLLTNTLVSLTDSLPPLLEGLQPVATETLKVVAATSELINIGPRPSAGDGTTHSTNSWVIAVGRAGSHRADRPRRPSACSTRSTSSRQHRKATVATVMTGGPASLGATIKGSVLVLMWTLAADVTALTSRVGVDPRSSLGPGCRSPPDDAAARRAETLRWPDRHAHAGAAELLRRGERLHQGPEDTASQATRREGRRRGVEGDQDHLPILRTEVRDKGVLA